MKVLIDTDAFCKLGVAGLLGDAVSCLGAQLSECEALPTLPYMLRRGGVVRRYGEENCDLLTSILETIPLLQQAPSSWLNRFLPVPGIDPGEAQLFSTAAEHKPLLLSGDKRALRSVREVEGAPEALSGLIVTLEAALIAVHRAIGTAALRHRVAPLRPFDTTVAICFSDSNSDPLSALWSYHNSLAAEVAPLALWQPPSETP
jgi:hypothetical protein